MIDYCTMILTGEKISFFYNCCLKYGHWSLENADINATYVDTRRLAKSIIWIFHLYGQMIIKWLVEKHFAPPWFWTFFWLTNSQKKHEVEIYLIIFSNPLWWWSLLKDRLTRDGYFHSFFFWKIIYDIIAITFCTFIIAFKIYIYGHE